MGHSSPHPHHFQLTIPSSQLWGMLSAHNIGHQHLQLLIEYLSAGNTNIYSRHYRESWLEPMTDGRDFYQRWIARVSGILCWPHARAYLFKGGLLWRIAIKFRLGPSEAVGSYEVVLHDFGAHLICDIYSPYELNIILDRTSGKKETWWLPKPDTWELNHPTWTGMWNDDQEFTFQSFMRNMRSSTHKPCNLGSWVHDLSRLPCPHSEHIWACMTKK